MHRFFRKELRRLGHDPDVIAGFDEYREEAEYNDLVATRSSLLAAERAGQ